MTTYEHRPRAPVPDFETFFDRSWTPCVRAVLATTLDRLHAEEDCAEAFARAYERWDSLQQHPAPAAWVVRTATNLHRDRHRRHRRLLGVLPRLARSDVHEDQDPDVDPALVSALEGLTRRQREVVALRVLLSLTGPETASALGISNDSVRVHLHRGLTSLRAAVAAPASPSLRVPLSQESLS